MFDNSPATIAKRLILQHGADLLIVNDDDYGTGYGLGERGIWHGGGEVWARWLDELAQEMRTHLIASGLEDKALASALRDMRVLRRKGMVDEVRPLLLAMLNSLRNQGQPCADVTECRTEDLDADTRYLGAANGVIDLYEGHLLSRAEGRTALVTQSTPVACDPAATHPDVDRLLAHLPDDLQEWWWASLGFGLLGQPSRAFYLCVGPSNGGKTTMVNAVGECLGAVYAPRPANDALESRRTAQAGVVSGTGGLVTRK